MSTQKVAITIDEKILRRLDRLVAARKFPNRSKAIQEAVEEKLERLERTRLAREAAKLDPAYEQSMADEGLAGDAGEWPAY
jgi:metal-responsive CopG/Arc/MetJ family transcriptional regulator